jgi:hypothetical protein
MIAEHSMQRKQLSQIRAAAGRAGAAARWAKEHRPTKLMRVYVDDADRITAAADADGVSAAEIVTRLLSRA